MDTARVTDSEQELIGKLKEKDPAGYHLAVRTYSPGMLAVARFYLDPSTAEEVVQDCWVSVF